MSIAFACACGRSFTVLDHLAGKWTRCSGCQAKIQVPAAVADGGFEVVEEAAPAAVPPISFACGCGQPLEVEAQYAGQAVECPTCQKVVTAPTAGPTLAKRASRPAVVEDDEPPRRRRFEEADASRAVTDKMMRDARRKLRADEERVATHRHRGGGFALNGGMAGGALAMFLAVVWLVVGLVFMNFLFYYPFILFVLGLIGFLKGLFGMDDD